MNVVYAQESLEQFRELGYRNTIFLAGPTPRASLPLRYKVGDAEHTKPYPSWRPEALGCLREVGFNGTVFVPEALDGTWNENYDAQVEWELEALFGCEVPLFWLGFKFPEMPGLTTRTEFGMVLSQKHYMVVGIPRWAERVSYQRHLTKHRKDYTFSTLLGACACAARICKDIIETERDER